MEEKRPMIGKFGVNPFVKAGAIPLRPQGREVPQRWTAKQKAVAGAGK